LKRRCRHFIGGEQLLGRVVTSVGEPVKVLVNLLRTRSRLVDDEAARRHDGQGVVELLEGTEPPFEHRQSADGQAPCTRRSRAFWSSPRSRKSAAVRLPARLTGLLGAGQLFTNDPEGATRAIAEWEAALDEQERPTPMVRLVEDRVVDALSEEPLFTGPVAHDVSAVASTTIRYVAHRLGAPKSFMRADFEGDSVVEQHLANVL
jgi:hypothetical protein